MDRKKFVDYILTHVEKMEKGNPTVGILKKRFDEMSDKEIEQIRDSLEKEEIYLPFFRANFADNPIDIESWKELAEEVDAEVFSHIWKEDALTGDVVKSIPKHWVGLMPTRRMIQYLNDKISTSEDNNVRDALTGQVTGASKSSALSNPQINALVARGCTSAATEFAKLRGGDVEVSRAFNKQISREGRAYQEPLLKMESRPEITETIKSYLLSIHLPSTL